MRSQSALNSALCSTAWRGLHLPALVGVLDLQPAGELAQDLRDLRRAAAANGSGTVSVPSLSAVRSASCTLPLASM